MVFTVLRIEEPEEMEMKNQSDDATIPKTKLANIIWNWISFLLKICALLLVTLMLIRMIPLLIGCAFMQTQRNLSGQDPAINMTPTQEKQIQNFIPLIASPLFVGMLLCFYVLILIIHAINPPEKPKLKKLVFQAKRSAIPNSSGKPQVKKVKPENKSECATSNMVMEMKNQCPDEKYKTKWNWIRFLFMVCALLLIITLVICIIPLLGCAFMQLLSELSGKDYAENIPTLQGITLNVANFIPLIAVLSVVSMLLFLYGLLLICGVYFPEDPKLKKIFSHAKLIVIRKPKDKKPKPEKESECATAKTFNNNNP